MTISKPKIFPASKTLLQLIITIRISFSFFVMIEAKLNLKNAAQAFNAADLWLIVKYTQWQSEQGDVILTCIVANTLHISKSAKATANTAPITLRITNSALISDGQSEGRKKKMRHLSYRPANALAG